MSAARRMRRAGRNLLVALLVGALIIVAIVIAYIAGRGSAAPSAGPTATSAAGPSDAAPASEPGDAAPTGCLGGPSRDSGMVLSAQANAQHTTFGAVELATAFYRWTYRFPVPSSAEIKAIAPVFAPSDSAAAQSSLRAGYAQNPNPSTGTVPNGTSFYLSTVSGQWVANAGASTGEVLVSVEAPYVVAGAISATKTATASFQMRWVNGRWRVAALAKGDPHKLTAGGMTFTAGC